MVSPQASMLQLCIFIELTMLAIMLHCLFPYYMQLAASFVQASYLSVSTCIFRVPISNFVTVVVVPQMLWAAAS